MNNDTRPLIPEPLAAPKLIYKSELLERVGKSYPTIWAWMRDGLFPRSVVVGSQAAWYAHEVEEWFANLPRQRLKGDPPAPAVEGVAKAALANAAMPPKRKLRDTFKRPKPGRKVERMPRPVRRKRREGKGSSKRGDGTC